VYFTGRRHIKKLLRAKIIRMGLDDADLCVLDRNTTLRDAYSDIVQAGRGSKVFFYVPFGDIGLVLAACYS